MDPIDFESDEFQDYLNKLRELSVYLKNFDKNIDVLFRTIHTAKALSYFYNLEEISILFEKTETILFFVNNYECKVEGIKKWLLMLSEQIDIWINEINRKEPISFFNIFFEEMPEVECKKRKDTINKNINIIVIDEVRQSEKIENIFAQKFKYVDACVTIEETLKLVAQPGNNIVISGPKFIDGNVIDLLRELKDINYKFGNFYLLVNFSEQEKFDNFRKKLKLKNVINLNIYSLNKVTSYIFKKYKLTANKVKIPNSRISLVELANQIKPISKTVLRLKEQCFGDSDIKDIVKTINSDPMFSGILLKNINTPFIGLPNRVQKVSIAVSLMGKKRVGSIVMSELAKDLFDNEPLDAYGIHIKDLMSLSQIRSRFVNEWLKYIDMPQSKKEDITALIHLLPIGKIITNKALIHNKSEKRYYAEYDPENPMDMETQLLDFSSYDAIVRIFELWNMPISLIEMAKSAANYGKKPNFKDIDMYAVIIILAVQIFRIDGSYRLEKSHIRFAEANNLAGQDMKVIFLSITRQRTKGRLFKTIK